MDRDLSCARQYHADILEYRGDWRHAACERRFDRTDARKQKHGVGDCAAARSSSLQLLFLAAAVAVATTLE